MRRLGTLGYFTTQLISLIDSGKHQYISMDDVKGHIDKGDLLSYLKEKLGNDINLSVFMPETYPKLSEAGKNLIDYLQRLTNVSTPETFGIKNDGLCLLLSYVLSLIDSKEWEGPTAQIISIYPELERLVENWAKLSPKIRSEIIEMSKE